MTLSTVPDYFQEETQEALREQAEWLIREVNTVSGTDIYTCINIKLIFAPCRAFSAADNCPARAGPG